LWLPPLVFGASLAVSALLSAALRRQWSLLAHGRPAQATVTQTKRGVPGVKTAASRVHYEFRILSGARRTGQYYVEKGAPPAGAALTVLYDPENPRRNSSYPLSLVRLGSHL
jgi:hypothetical protein